MRVVEIAVVPEVIPVGKIEVIHAVRESRFPAEKGGVAGEDEIDLHVVEGGRR